MEWTWVKHETAFLFGFNFSIQKIISVRKMQNYSVLTSSFS